MENIKKEKLREAMELCLAVYRLTDDFPADEVLKQKIREAALDFLEKFIFGDADGIIKQTRMLGCFFALAQKQGWVAVKNYGVLFAAYKKLAAAAGEPLKDAAPQVENIGEKKEAAADKKANIKEARSKNSETLTDRQKSIADLLKDKTDGANFGAITLGLGKKGFMDVTPRTIRNDLKQLVEFGLVEQKGWAKNSFYKLKGAV